MFFVCKLTLTQFRFHLYLPFIKVSINQFISDSSVTFLDCERKAPANLGIVGKHQCSKIRFLIKFRNHIIVKHGWFYASNDFFFVKPWFWSVFFHHFLIADVLAYNAWTQSQNSFRAPSNRNLLNDERVL